VIRGVPKFDGIAIGEFTVNFMGQTLEMRAKAAFVDSKTGSTHGATEHRHWSEMTIEKLKELRAAMELDLGQLHFEGGGSLLLTAAQGRQADEGGGLGDHVGGGQV
jgi:hypothetical protein